MKPIFEETLWSDFLGKLYSRVSTLDMILMSQTSFITEFSPVSIREFLATVLELWLDDLIMWSNQSLSKIPMKTLLSKNVTKLTGSEFVRVHLVTADFSQHVCYVHLSGMFIKHFISYLQFLLTLESKLTPESYISAPQLKPPKPTAACFPCVIESWESCLHILQASGSSVNISRPISPIQNNSYHHL